MVSGYLTIVSKHLALGFGKRTFNTSSKSRQSDFYSSVIPYFKVTDIINHGPQFDEIIDVRTPLEFSEDRILTSVNVPVLTNEQRVNIGTLYDGKKLEARRQGTALISRNIADYLETFFASKPKNYKPLIYCWRGGQRSRSLAIILHEIGFQPTLLSGGYKAYRKMVRENLFDENSELSKLKLIRISGSTGCGKSLLLEILKEKGEQIIDLEYLAKHKGSVLGQFPCEDQPSQRMFESFLYNQIKTELNPEKVVWIENESSKIGKVIIPNLLLAKMRLSPRIQINACLEDRVKFILQDYSYLCSESNKETLLKNLSDLERHAGKRKSSYWCDLVKNYHYEELVQDLIVNYYDLNYKKPKELPIEHFELPHGILLNRDDLFNASIIDKLISFGNEQLLSEREGPVNFEHIVG